MKLIKQNEDSGGLIFRQNVAGKAMKQNYNYGRAWKSYNLGSAYIEINKEIPPNTPFTIMFFHKKTSENNVPRTPFLHSSGTSTDFAYYYNVVNNRYVQYNTAVKSDIATFLYATTFDGTTIKVLNTSNVLETFSASLLTTSIPSLLLSRTSSSVQYAKINGLTIYDRAISQEELNYRRNNNLGEELLNSSNLWAEYALTGAEILNTGGADFVGIKDSSINNRHEPILSLPAGTLQEQLDWANANCFENF